MTRLHYQPFWCEENIWHLAGDPAFGPGARHVLLITGAGGHVACWNQRAADAGVPVLWDYHVVLAQVDGRAWRIWDLDSRAGCPVAAGDWLAATFPVRVLVPAEHQPRFLTVPAEEFRREFSSDRAHMRAAGGGWMQPPPPWPAISGGSVPLATYLGRARAGFELAEAVRRWSRR